MSLYCAVQGFWSLGPWAQGPRAQEPRAQGPRAQGPRAQGPKGPGPGPLGPGPWARAPGKKSCFVSTGGNFFSKMSVSSRREATCFLKNERFVSTGADFWNTQRTVPGSCGNGVSSCGSDPTCTRAGGKDDGSYKLPQITCR